VSECAEIIAAFEQQVEACLAAGGEGPISDGELARVMTAAARLYATRCEARDAFPPPVLRDKVTPTDILTTVCEMIRVADINLFDLSMWHGRARSAK
jgi:hypothetical protein